MPSPAETLLHREAINASRQNTEKTMRMRYMQYFIEAVQAICAQHSPEAVVSPAEIVVMLDDAAIIANGRIASE